MDIWCFKHQKGMNYKSAKLNDANGDLDHRWFVFYYFRDPDTGKWVRFRTWISAQLITRSLRYDRAKEIQKEINIKLLQGCPGIVRRAHAAPAWAAPAASRPIHRPSPRPGFWQTPA